MTSGIFQKSKKCGSRKSSCLLLLSNNKNNNHNPHHHQKQIHLFANSPTFPSLFSLIIVLILVAFPFVGSLTSEERGELARKFKYYHKSVRPSEKFNMVDTINGTFFRLLTQLELTESREIEMRAQINLEMSFFVHFRDDRLQLRDLSDLPIPIPEEFQPWQPRIQMFPLGTARNVQIQRTTNLSPKNGQITLVQRFFGPVPCDFDQWKVPFEHYKCQFWFQTDPDERLHLTVVRDLRPNDQMTGIRLEYEQWPWLLLSFTFHSGQWQSALVSIYLPSTLLLCCALLAQWKRRKIQVIVTVGAILALILMQCGQVYSTLTFSVTLLDLWLAGIFVHLVCLLSADLLLPARRVLLLKGRRIGQQKHGQDEQWISHDERSHPQIQQIGYPASPSKGNLRRKIGGIQNGPSPPFEHSYHFGHGRPIKAIYYPHSSTSLHHYVSSPQLGHRQVPIPRQRMANLPPAPTSTAQMIRTFSVPPRRLDDIRGRMDQQQSMEQQGQLPLPQSFMGGSAPLIRKREETGDDGGMPIPMPNGDGERQRAIATLLSEMENIRRAESIGSSHSRQQQQQPQRQPQKQAQIGGTTKTTTTTFPKATSSEEEEEEEGQHHHHHHHQFMDEGGQPVAVGLGLLPSSHPPPPPPPPPNNRPPIGPPHFHQLLQSQRSPYDAKESGEASEELGRIEGAGMPRRKRLVLYAISMSFCLFILAYILLVASAFYGWL